MEAKAYYELQFQRRLRKMLTKEQLEHSLNKLDIWLVIFGVLVAIGVVGESVAGFLHWRRGGDLQKLQDLEVTKARVDAVLAAQKAGELGVSVATLNTFVAEQQKRVSLSMAILKQSQVSLDAAVKAATDRANQAMQTLKPRVLSDIEQEELISRLKHFNGLPFGMSLQVGDEPSSLLRQLAKALDRANWTWTKSSQQGLAIDIEGRSVTLLTSASGIIVEYDFKKSAQWTSAIDSLVSTLSEFGIPARANRVTQGGIDPDIAQIYVGARL